MRKRACLYAIYLILFLSCNDKQTNQEKLNSLINEYYTENIEKKGLGEDFEHRIFSLRDEAVTNKNYEIIEAIDNILLDGSSAPNYRQDYHAIDTVSALNRKCKAIDDAPADVERIKSNSLRLRNTPITIKVAFHVIQANDGSGFLSNVVLQNQFSQLNSNFSNTIFSFELESIDYSTNDNWYYNVDENNIYENQMHNELSLDPETRLNVYFVGNESYYGYAKFPWKDRSRFDGVVIYNGTVPGGTLTNYNEGKTLTHEVGHYLGLWHTFHKGCRVGDNVDDTPEQNYETSGCPTNKDTCPNLMGLDPINNYMDYSYDSCMSEFTQGQNQRMNWAIRKYRKELVISGSL